MRLHLPSSAGHISERADVLKKAIAEAYDAGYLGRNILGSVTVWSCICTSAPAAI